MNKYVNQTGIQTKNILLTNKHSQTCKRMQNEPEEYLKRLEAKNDMYSNFVFLNFHKEELVHI